MLLIIIICCEIGWFFDTNEHILQVIKARVITSNTYAHYRHTTQLPNHIPYSAAAAATCCSAQLGNFIAINIININIPRERERDERVTSPKPIPFKCTCVDSRTCPLKPIAYRHNHRNRLINSYSLASRQQRNACVADCPHERKPLIEKCAPALHHTCAMRRIAML